MAALRLPRLSDEEIRKFWSRADVGGRDECWNWRGTRHNRGYGIFLKKIEGRWRQMHASRVAVALSSGKDPVDFLVCHRCDNPPCVNPNHLFLSDHYGNQHDKIRKGRSAQQNLEPEAVKEIRSLYARGEQTLTDLAADFGVRSKTIKRAVVGASWRHVGGPLSRIDERRGTRGERSFSAKLSNADVVRIRSLRTNTGLTLRRIGDRFGVSESTVCRVVKRERWAHVE